MSEASFGAVHMYAFQGAPVLPIPVLYAIAPCLHVRASLLVAGAKAGVAALVTTGAAVGANAGAPVGIPSMPSRNQEHSFGIR